MSQRWELSNSQFKTEMEISGEKKPFCSNKGLVQKGTSRKGVLPGCRSLNVISNLYSGSRFSVIFSFTSTYLFVPYPIAPLPGSVWSSWTAGLWKGAEGAIVSCPVPSCIEKVSLMWGPEEGIWASGIGVIGGCELACEAGNWVGVFCKSRQCFWLLSCPSSLEDPSLMNHIFIVQGSSCCSRIYKSLIV